MASLSDYCTPDELRYVRDMITAIVKRKTKKAVGPLTERRTGSNLNKTFSETFTAYTRMAREPLMISLKT